MPTLSPKENMIRLYKGEIPEYVPSMMDGGSFMGPMLGPDLMGFMAEWDSDVKYDLFGVPNVREWNANNGPIPQPGVFILDDITKWRDVIKRPPILDEIDWQLLADQQLPHWDPSTFKTGMASVGNGYFQILASFMGFDMALISCVEEPEEVKDLLNFILGMNNELAKKFIYYYEPETGGNADDIAHERAPFISIEMFEDIFEPLWRADILPYIEAGCLTSHHNCGMFEPLVPYIVDMGFNAWNPAEWMNDLVGIKQRFPKLALCGGFNDDRVRKPEHTEEDIRAYVREVVDELAPGGGYAFGGYMMGPPGDPVVEQRMGWMYDEFEKIRYSYYD